MRHILFICIYFFSDFTLAQSTQGSPFEPIPEAVESVPGAGPKSTGSSGGSVNLSAGNLSLQETAEEQNIRRQHQANLQAVDQANSQCAQKTGPAQVSCFEAANEALKKSSKEMMDNFRLSKKNDLIDLNRIEKQCTSAAGPLVRVCDPSRPTVCSNFDKTTCLEFVSKTRAQIDDDLKDGDNCESSHKRAMMVCSPGKFAADIQSMISQVQVAHSSGNMRNMCAGAEKLNKILGSVNAGISAGCFATRASCLSVCRRAKRLEEGRSLYEKCDKFMDTVVGAAQQSAMNFLTGALAGKCKKDLDDPNNPANNACFKPGAENNRDCKAAYCGMAWQFPQRKEEQLCKDLFGPNWCDTPEQQSLVTCICFKNPRDSRCNAPQIVQESRQNPWGNFQNNPNIPGLGGGNGGAGGGIGDIGDGDGVGEGLDLPKPGDELAPGQRQENKTAYGGGQGGGGGGFAGGAQGFGLEGGQGGGGAAGSGLNTDVITGTVPGGGGGDASAAGGGGGDGDGSMGGSGGGGRGGDDDKIGKFSLKDFLPGGAQDPSRNPASADSLLLQNGITGAEGLSNFEKVTRKMNQKRSSLVP